MSSKTKENAYHELYFDIAKRVAEMSHCQRLKVGCIIVKDGRIVSMGWNGMPRGMDNTCEIYDDNGDSHTRIEVLHAERNAIDKLARTHESGIGTVMYVTHAPCIECAKSIYGAGIETLYYINNYRSCDGIDFLESIEIPAIKWSDI